MESSLFKKSDFEIEEYLQEKKLRQFLHGKCTAYAGYLSELHNKEIEILLRKREDGLYSFVHCYNTTMINGKEHYIDIRGITSNKEKFLNVFTQGFNEKYITEKFKNFK